jgi:hypothetical protein
MQPRPPTDNASVGIALAASITVLLAVTWMLQNSSGVRVDVWGISLPRWGLALLIFMAGLAVGVFAGTEVEGIDTDTDLSDEEYW